MSNNAWFQSAIAHGLQHLVVLRLQNAPSEDSIELVLNVWCKALSKNKAWDKQLDEDRIKSAFITLCSTCEKWPSPKQFLDVLAPRSEPVLIEKSNRLSDEQRARYLSMLQKLKQMVGVRV